RCRASTVAAAAHERGPHEPLFECLARVVEAPGVVAVARSELRRQRGWGHHTTPGTADGECGHHVLQLANVAWPIIARERGQRRRRQGRFAADALARLAPEMLR